MTITPDNVPALAPPSDAIAVLDEAGAVRLVHDGCAPEVMRGRIAELQAFLLEAADSHEELPVEHLVADGMYLRKLFIPKGTLLVGRIHLRHCMNVVAKGDITVLTEIGVARLTAGAFGLSAPGIQKVGYAHEDTVFINVFRTDQTDIALIEAEVAAEAPLARAPHNLKELPCPSQS